MDVDDLPDLSDGMKALSTTTKGQRSANSSVKPKPQRSAPNKSKGSKEKLQLETKSKVNTNKNKDHRNLEDSDGFTNPPVKKRAKGEISKDHEGCDTSNTFDPLKDLDTSVTSMETVEGDNNLKPSEIPSPSNNQPSSSDSKSPALGSDKTIPVENPSRPNTHATSKLKTPPASKMKRLHKNFTPQHASPPGGNMFGKKV